MPDYSYVKRFEKLGFGIFVHFGLYSMVAKGEWYLCSNPKAKKEKYESLMHKFNVSKNWAKDLVKTAKKIGAKYITITTRHHDGFSLYDAGKLSDYDAPHSASKRDLIKEFVDECNKEGIIPFFYHTLIDWHHPTYTSDFNNYLDYLYKSVEILCTKYGKIGGLWFDGFWSKPNADWKFDRLYQMIKSYQPEAMIINNTGMSDRGKVSHPLVDSLTFERGRPTTQEESDRPRACEMCETITDHWGYTKKDITFKPAKELIDTLLTCRYYNSNLLLNIGPKGNGILPTMEKSTLLAIGEFLKANKFFIYDVKKADIEAENAMLLKDDKHYYAAVTGVEMVADPNVAINHVAKTITIKTNKKIKNAKYLDNNHKAKIENDQIKVEPFAYGESLYARVIQFDLE
ncbi:MAG: alpha-L-fucosidase [Bacilli bacterium]|nr:alpha-L-fucosidase [Bacilli bacterium]